MGVRGVFQGFSGGADPMLVTIGNFWNISRGSLKRLPEINGRPKKVLSTPQKRFYPTPFWHPKGFYKTPVKGPYASFEAIFCLRGYFGFLRLFLKTLQKCPSSRQDLPPPLPPLGRPKFRPWSEFSLPRNSDHGLSFSFPHKIQSLAWSEFWSEFCLDHGLSFVPRSQKPWGRGRPLGAEPFRTSIKITSRGYF